MWIVCLLCLLCGCAASPERVQRALSPSDTVACGCDCSDEHFIDVENRPAAKAFALQKTAYNYTHADVLESLCFVADSAKISPRQREKIVDIAALFAKNRSLRILLVGRYDEFGAEMDEYFLGQRRAEAVRDALIELGIDGKRITTASIGSRTDEKDATPMEGGESNMRCDIVIRSM
ncbi:MAG: OmpA family protein [Puniceicoccales bacterium]|jgi:outer membrane protein OmpA-like peptidoglycan-associated protein|nr:OmpA family protein [Puniceicoccales bacterium]